MKEDSWGLVFRTNIERVVGSKMVITFPLHEAKSVTSFSFSLATNMVWRTQTLALEIQFGYTEWTSTTWWCSRQA